MRIFFWLPLIGLFEAVFSAGQSSCRTESGNALARHRTSVPHHSRFSLPATMEPQPQKRVANDDIMPDAKRARMESGGLARLGELRAIEEDDHERLYVPLKERRKLEVERRARRRGQFFTAASTGMDSAGKSARELAEQADIPAVRPSETLLAVAAKMKAHVDGACPRTPAAC